MEKSRYDTSWTDPDAAAMDRDDIPSKSRKKREMHSLQALGAELVQLRRDQLAQLGLPEPLRDAIAEAQRIKGFEARRRQLQYIGRLMREVDPAPLRAQLDAWSAPSHEQAAAHKLAEAWRARLLAETEPALAELLVNHPGANAQHLRLLVQDAQRERRSGQPPRRYRELFRVVRGIVAQDSAGT